MLVLIAILLALLPAAAILYPFLRQREAGLEAEDESSPQVELARRWDAALEGLKSAELERAIGNLAQEDYLWLRQQYMAEATALLRALELEQQQEEDLLEGIEQELLEVRKQALGGSADGNQEDASLGALERADESPGARHE